MQLDHLKSSLQRLYKKTKEKKTRKELKQLLLELETLEAEDIKPPDKRFKKTLGKVSDAMFGIVTRYSEHQVVKFILEKIRDHL